MFTRILRENKTKPDNEEKRHATRIYCSTILTYYGNHLGKTL